jgi:8-oxo-dGTP diphosphatase
MKPIRNSAKAIIIRNGMLLCTKNQDKFGIFYLLPGGGQESQESMHEALKRECKEEISADIVISDIKFIREYIGKNHEFAEWDSDIHQIEYMFECQLKADSNIQNGSVPDSMQIGVEWIPIKSMNEYRIYPKTLRKIITPYGKFNNVVYLGDVN